MDHTTPDYYDVESTSPSPLCNSTSPYYVGKVKIFEFVLKCVVLPIIVSGGLVGNTLCYLVLSRERRQKSLNFILKALSVADSLVLISLVFMQTLPSAYSHSGGALEYQIFYLRVGKPVIIFVQWTWKTASIYLTLFVTLERYVAVSRPFQAQFICTLRNARLGTFFIMVFSILYNIPKLLYYEMYQEAYDFCLERVAPLGGTTALYKSRIFIDVYVIGLYFVVIYIIPLLALFILNYFLIVMVRKSYKERERLGGQVSHEKCTEKIIGIVTAFIVLETPAIIVNLYYSQKSELTGADLQALNMIYILSAINCVINFYIYVLVGKAFRHRLLLFLGCRRTELSSTSSRKVEDSYVVKCQQAEKKGHENGVHAMDDHTTHL